MVETGTPANRSHGAWLLALLALANGRHREARAWIDAAETADDELILPLYPMDVTDEPHLVCFRLEV